MFAPGVTTVHHDRSWRRPVGGALNLAWACLGAIACGPKLAPPSIEVTVKVNLAVKSTCLKVVAIPASGVEELSTGVPIKDPVEAAIYPSATLFGTVAFLARGYIGKGCDEPLVFNDESPPVTETFAPGATFLPAASACNSASAKM